MQTTKASQQPPDASEQDLARKLRRQVAEWKTIRAPLRTRTAAGVQVERRSRRRPPSVASRLDGHSVGVSVVGTDVVPSALISGLSQTE